MRFYYVNPANTADIEGPYFIGQPVILANGLQITGNLRGVGLDIYEATEDNTPCPYPAYQLRTLSTSFAGVVGDYLGSSVVEAKVCTDSSLEDLYQLKRDELTSYANSVFDSPFQHDVATLEFWAVADSIGRGSRSSYNGYLGTRGHDILFDAVQAGIDAGGGTNNEVAAFWAALVARQGGGDAYWTRDIRVFLYDRVTLALVRDEANQNQWSDLMLSQGTFDWQIRAASDRVSDALATAYNDGAGDWTTLADIDVKDPTFNWPPHYSGPPLGGAGTITIAEMLAR